MTTNIGKSQLYAYEQAEQVIHEELIKLGKANNCGNPIIKAIKYYGKA